MLLSRKEWASWNLISVDDFSLGKGLDFVIFVEPPIPGFVH